MEAASTQAMPGRSPRSRTSTGSSSVARHGQLKASSLPIAPVTRVMSRGMGDGVIGRTTRRTLSPITVSAANHHHITRRLYRSYFHTLLYSPTYRLTSAEADTMTHYERNRPRP